MSLYKLYGLFQLRRANLSFDGVVYYLAIVGKAFISE